MPMDLRLPLAFMNLTFQVETHHFVFHKSKGAQGIVFDFLFNCQEEDYFIF